MEPSARTRVSRSRGVEWLQLTHKVVIFYAVPVKEEFESPRSSLAWLLADLSFLTADCTRCSSCRSHCMHNALSSSRTTFQSQTRGKRQSLRPAAFAATFVAAGLIAVTSGGRCGERSSGSLLSWQGRSATGLRRKVGSVSDIPRQGVFDANQPAPRYKLQQDGWSVNVETHSGGVLSCQDKREKRRRC